MLSRRNCIKLNNNISSSITIIKRNFFDYLRVANDIDNGKTMSEIELEFRKEDDTKESASFGWQWLSWFENNAPEKYAEYASSRSQFQLLYIYISQIRK